MRKNIEGKRVHVKATPHEWGVVRLQEDNDIHVAMYEDDKEVRLFDRDELVVENDS